MIEQKIEITDLLALKAVLKLKQPKGSCLIGFDGYVDEIYHAVEKSRPGQPQEFYQK